MPDRVGMTFAKEPWGKTTAQAGYGPTTDPQITRKDGPCEFRQSLLGRGRSSGPGRVMDLCEVKTPTIESAAPEGWVAFDPYTGMTYCPDCWASIEAPTETPRPAGLG